MRERERLGSEGQMNELFFSLARGVVIRVPGLVLKGQEIHSPRCFLPLTTRWKDKTVNWPVGCVASG